MQSSRRVPSVVKAQAHNDGTGRLPKREFLGTTEQETERLVQRLRGRIEARIK